MTSPQQRFILNHQGEYPDGFFHWLQKNRHIWLEFEQKALQMARIRKRYSARTIVEVMRWHSDLKEAAPLFKLSNNMTPGMARLWMEKHGRKYPKFFCLHQK